MRYMRFVLFWEGIHYSLIWNRDPLQERLELTMSLEHAQLEQQ